ncbi:DUF6192 family protein [Streptomyces syringium]|uniref:DUF6192 family protein n=1 Tax=Streptomyces syringium TaxID=76729 RepID=UPI00340EFA7C
MGTDAANRRVGRQVENPETPQEKISAVHTLARDEEVAAAVTTDLLKRPQAAAQVPTQSAAGSNGLTDCRDCAERSIPTARSP